MLTHMNSVISNFSCQDQLHPKETNHLINKDSNQKLKEAEEGSEVAEVADLVEAVEVSEEEEVAHQEEAASEAVASEVEVGDYVYS